MSKATYYCEICKRASDTKEALLAHYQISHMHDGVLSVTGRRIWEKK